MISIYELRTFNSEEHEMLMGESSRNSMRSMRDTCLYKSHLFTTLSRALLAGQELVDEAVKDKNEDAEEVGQPILAPPTVFFGPDPKTPTWEAEVKIGPNTMWLRIVKHEVGA